jgi:regulator of protease activity HflC (stomatin/prohibitin superfamily)
VCRGQEGTLAQRKAEADAQAYQILAEAKAKAEGNDLIAKSLTAEFITYTQWQQWDGRLPSTVMGGATGSPVVTLPLPPQ